MGTFTNPTSDSSSLTNAPLSSVNRTWAQSTEEWQQDIGVEWQNPYAPYTNPDSHSSTLNNATTH